MFFNLLSLIFFFSACSMGVLQKGGDRPYIYDVYSDYSSEDLKMLSPEVVKTFSREPIKGKLSDLFSVKQKPIKRVGIIVFETAIQETRSGLSGQDKVYLSEEGKQLFTERLLSIWEQSFPLMTSGVVYVPSTKLKRSNVFKTYGLDVADYIKGNRESIEPDDIYFLSSGKNTTTTTILNPRGMRDLSLALVPASQLMQGPKFSEHMKHAVNDLAKELKLDAVFVVMSEIFWTASHIDKQSGEMVPEQVNLNMQTSTLIPLSDYHARLNHLGEFRDLPSITIAFRAYESKITIPVLLSVGENDQFFGHIEKELLLPIFKTYKDQTQMVIYRMLEDIKGTHH